MKRFLPVLTAVLVGAIALAAEQLVNQGSPGTRGPWPVTFTNTGLDGGSTSATSVTPQQCNGGPTSKITSVGVAAGTTPSTQLAFRRYIVLCNSVQNTGNPLVKCRADGVAPVMAATNAGDVLGIGDCLPYYVADSVTISCIADAAATYVTSSECL